MADEIKEEEFNTTEIKIEEVESDTLDDWEVMSKYEADVQIPYISVPKMHELAEENDSISCATSIESKRQNEQGIFSQYVSESEIGRKSEGKQEQLCSHQQYKQSEKLARDNDEVMRDKSFHRSQEQENKRIESEIAEAMQDTSEIEQENYRVQGEISEALQDVSLKEKENNRVKRGTEEALQGKSLQEQELDRVQREVLEPLPDVSQNEQENDRIRREMKEIMQGDTSTSIAPQCSKLQTRAVEGESFAKAEENKSKVPHRQYSAALRQFFTVNPVVRDQVTTEVAENDLFVSEKDLWEKVSSENLELTQNEELSNSSSDEEAQDMDEFMKKLNS